MPRSAHPAASAPEFAARISLLNAPGRPSLLRRPLLWVVLAELVLVVLASFVGAEITSTLDARTQWTSGKSLLEMPAMGSKQYGNSRQTLAGAALDLGRWHGYQEVFTTEPVELGALQFRVKLGKKSYLLAEFGRDEDRFSAIRLSNFPRLPSQFMTVARSGEYLDHQELDLGEFPVDLWHSVRVELGEGEITVRIDDRAPVSVPCAAPRVGQIGFRGCQRQAFVDDVQVFSPTGDLVFHDSFFPRTSFLRFLGFGAIGTFALHALCVWILRLLRRRSHQAAYAFLTAILVVVAGSAVGAFALLGPLSKTYTRDRASEQVWRDAHADEVLHAIREAKGTDGQSAATRVLFVGTSQTYGCSAEHREESFVERLERELNAHLEHPVECINTGTKGALAETLVRRYEQEWIDLEPDLVVVNLSSNDVAERTPEESFRASLLRLARLNQEREITTLFCLEANSSERFPRELPLHPIVEEVANESGFTIVDTHTAMRQATDRGLLWWDFVHPTSFGHQVLARTLLPVLLEELGSQSGR